MRNAAHKDDSVFKTELNYTRKNKKKIEVTGGKYKKKSHFNNLPEKITFCSYSLTGLYSGSQTTAQDTKRTFQCTVVCCLQAYA
jgi:hypothetical protein